MYQLPLWLTLNFSLLCVFVYIYTYVPGLAPAHPPWMFPFRSPKSRYYHQNLPKIRKNAYEIALKTAENRQFLYHAITVSISVDDYINVSTG